MEITVGLRTYTELLSVLNAKNEIFLQGQHIWAIDDVTGSMKKGLKVGDFDPDTMAPGAGTPFIALPWQLAPANAGTNGFTPFSIERSDPAFDDTSGVDTVITDARLIGVTTVAVLATDRGTYFRKAEKVINPTLGTVTLLGYAGMAVTEELWIFIPSAIVVSATLTALDARVAKLEVYARPFTDPAGGAKVVWNRPRNTIPAGWREWTGIYGKIPIPQDPTDLVNPALPYDAITNPSINGFGRPLGSVGGSVFHSITGTNFLPKFRLFTVVNQYAAIAGHPDLIGRALNALRSMILHYYKNDVLPGYGGSQTYELCGSEADNQEPTISPTSWVGQDIPDAINHMNPYQLVHYIEPNI